MRVLGNTIYGVSVECKSQRLRRLHVGIWNCDMSLQLCYVRNFVRFVR